MFELILAAGFTAFFLAVFDYFINLVAITTGPLFINTVMSLSTATLGSYLAGFDFNKKFIVVAVAAAFIGKSALKITERVITSRPSVVNSVGQ